MDRNEDKLHPVRDLALPDDVLLALAPAARLAAVGAVAGGAAHGLANSLFGVLGLVELLLADADPGSPAAERLVLVRGAALDLKETLGALVDATRPVAEDGDPAPLDEIVRSTAAFLRRTSAAVRLSLDESHPEEPLPVVATRTTVRQLVLHVLQHAWTTAGMDGAVTLETSRDGGSALVRASARGDGTGSEPDLGLLVAGALARAAGGSLEAPSPGSLLLRLPLPPSPAEKPRGDSAAPTMTPGRGRDDDGDARR